jgi:hypothetical protein
MHLIHACHLYFRNGTAVLSLASIYAQQSGDGTLAQVRANKGLKSVGSPGELGSDPTFDASVEDIQREGAAGEDLIMEGLEVELCA